MRNILAMLFGKSEPKQDQISADMQIARQRNDRAADNLRSTLDDMLTRNDSLHLKPSSKGKEQ